MANPLDGMTQERWNRLTDKERDSLRDLSGLTPQLVGLERERVEVIDTYGETRRFYVGRSTGWRPCHIELKLRNSSGGMAVMGAPFKSVRRTGQRR